MRRRAGRFGRVSALAGVLVALAASLPGTVHAAVPITIGQGFAPGVAVDPAGTAYVAWYGPESTTNTLRFCRVPRGAAGCDVGGVIAAPGTTLTRPFVHVVGSTVLVVSYRYGLSGPNFDRIYLFTSTDGGATFDGGREIGTVPFNDAAIGPGVAVSFATDAVTQGELYERAPLDGSPAPAQRATLSTDHPYSGTVALLDANTPLVAFADANGNAQFRRYAGSGDPNDAANWTPAQDIGHDEYMHLASGPSGLFLKGRTAGRTLEVRRFNGSTFGPGVNLPEGTGELPQSHLFQDRSGRLHAVWPRIDVDGTRLYYATSDDGVAWLSGLMLTGPDGIARMRVATAADHVGVAVWDNGTTSNPLVRLVPVGPTPPVPPPELGRTANAVALEGDVLVKLPDSGRAGFVPLREARQIPVRSVLDTRRGTVRLTTARGSTRTQSGEFAGGIFQVLQSRKRRARGLTELRLKGSGFARCQRGKGASVARLSRRTIRRLRSRARGRYRSRGRHSAATVRGTVWTVADRCDGTLTTVKRGKVAVRDFRRRKTIVVRAGKRYLARAPG
jgi:hypothetical protein